MVDMNDYSHKIVEALNRMFYASYYCDLKTQTFVTIQFTEHSKKMLEDIVSLPQAFQRFIQVLVKPEDTQAMIDFCNIETLPARLKNERYISCDYDSRLEDGWRQAGFLPVDYDENQEVSQVLFVISNLDAGKVRKLENAKNMHQMMEIQQKAAQLVSASEILSVALIDKDSGLTQINTNFHRIDENEKYTLEECLKMELPYIASVDREKFKQNITLENLKLQVEKQGHYQLEASVLDENGRYYYVVHHYTELGDGQHLLSVEEDATNQVSIDAVTGSINRTGFSKRAQIYIENAEDAEYAVLCFNIQKFKAVNSWYGFENGDLVLRDVTEWIRSSKMKPLLISRENADVFFCLIRRENLDDQEIERLCRTHMCVESIQIPVSLNCGVYIVENHEEEIHSICDKARLACNACLKQTEALICKYDTRIRNDYLEQASILQNLSSAIQSKQFQVYYQPIYDAKTVEIVSAEALVRWQHPEYGLIGPATFLSVIEQNGRISELDNYVGNCVWMMQNRRKQKNQRLVPVAVNMSRYDFLKKECMDAVLQLVQKNSQMSSMIRLEVTESGFADIQEDGRKFLEQLRQLGCKVLVDDFGSGYSSLGMLADFDCDIIKLDMSFARSIGKNRRVEILISAAINAIHEMGLQVIAEGVETKEQYDFLRNHDCDYIQGYYFSRPVSEKAFEELLEL